MMFQLTARLTSKTTLVTRGTRSRASFSFPSSSATTTSRLVQVNTALEIKLNYSLEYCLTPDRHLPFCNFLVSSEHTVLNVYGMISHSPEYQGLVQSSDHKHGVVIF